MGKEVEEKIWRENEDSDFIDIIGGNGTWQKTIFAFFVLTAIPVAWHTMVISFMAPNLKFWCANPNYPNTTTKEWISKLGPFFNGSELDQLDQCLMYDFIENKTPSKELDTANSTLILNITTNGTNSFLIKQSSTPCRLFEFDDTEYTNTIVSEWNLVCSKEWLVSFSKSIYMGGLLLSLLTNGQLADKIGRKPVLMASLCIFIVSAIICTFSITFIMFVVSRFFVGFGIAGLFNTSFTHLMEVISPESRSFYGIGIEFGWAVGYVVLPAMGWLIRDWKWLQVSITVPCIALFIMWWYIPESPRWLITQGKLEKAKRILTKAAKANGKDVQDVENALKKLWAKNQTITEGKTTKCNIFDIFRAPRLLPRTLNLCFAWIVAAFIYYGLSYNTNDLAGDPFVNFAIAGAVEFPAYFLSIFVIKSLGRKKPLMLTFVAGGISCLLTLPLTGDLAWISMPLAMFGKFCITAAFAILFVYTAEIFPTVTRNTGLGFCSTFARIGSMTAPFAKELGQATHPAVPLSSFGVLSVVSGLLVLLLPETNGKKVPDTLEEAAEMGRKKKPVVEENEEIQKPCIIHVGNNETNEKPKDKSNSPFLNSASDGKKLPDLLEEPSVVDEVTDEGQEYASDVYQCPKFDGSTALKSSEGASDEQVELKDPTQNESMTEEKNHIGDNTQQTPL